jgi:hypothetical protein
MAFNNNLPYWAIDPDKACPLPASGANNVYIVGKQRLVRIIPASDTYVRFGTTSSLVLASSTNGALLKANQEYFIGSNECQFMSLSNNTANVVVLTQEDFS